MPALAPPAGAQGAAPVGGGAPRVGPDVAREEGAVSLGTVAGLLLILIVIGFLDLAYTVAHSRRVRR